MSITKLQGVLLVRRAAQHIYLKTPYQGRQLQGLLQCLLQCLLQLSGRLIARYNTAIG